MMKIYPVVSNVIKVELEDGSVFELYEGAEGLSIKALDGTLIAKELNISTIHLDEIWRGSAINLSKEA